MFVVRSVEVTARVPRSSALTWGAPAAKKLAQVVAFELKTWSTSTAPGRAVLCVCVSRAVLSGPQEADRR